MRLPFLFYLSAATLTTAVFFLFRDRILEFLKQKEIYRRNYSGAEVITAGGLLLLFPCLFGAVPFLFAGDHPSILIYFMMAFSLTFCGMLDDILGDSSSKGLSGHVGRFLKGGISTGGIKALTGGMIGLLLAWSRYRGLVLFLLDTICFALCVNLINLLDLRPGRAIKGFLFLLILLLAAAGLKEAWPVLPAVTALSLYLSGEMKEVYMLGDTGANLLGGVLGFYGVTALPVHAEFFLVLFLASVHLLAEFQSLSKWIDAVPVLKKIDMLGRKDVR
jgi:UDP-N-acetylmuramyl pentapeptide phosphotransferase/UDP-N-acetylglucosamine-1-phosphate transferase